MLKRLKVNDMKPSAAVFHSNGSSSYFIPIKSLPVCGISVGLNKKIYKVKPQKNRKNFHEILRLKC